MLVSIILVSEEEGFIAMRDVLFSVIVPVYNVENYLHECMDSLMSQTFDEYEIILVDDGSTDSSGLLCDEYEKASRKVKVIHQTNKGLSEARNSGIRHSIGEYLLFVDSDDVIEKDSLERFARIVLDNRVDIVTAKAYIMREDGTISPKVKNEFFTNDVFCGARYAESSIRRRAFTACAPFNMYSRSFVVNNGLFFKPWLTHEDILWTPSAFYLASSVICGNFFFYYHRVRIGSITHGTIDATIRGAKDMLTACEELYSFSMTLPKCKTRNLRDYMAMIYMSATYTGRLDKIEDLKLKRFFPLKNAHSASQMIKSLLYAISPTLYCTINSCCKR